MKRKKRATALFLCLLMLTNCPINAFATEGVSDSEIVVVETTAPTETVDVCEECGGSDIHTDGCSLNTNDSLTDESLGGCTECEQTEGHLENCSQYIAPTEACSECNQIDGHIDTCSQYVLATETTTSPVEEATEPTTESIEASKDDVVSCTECNQIDGHADTCSQYEVPFSSVEHLLAAESIEEMYSLLLELMQDKPETLLSLSADEIVDLRVRINELDPEGDDVDTQDLLDTLAYIEGQLDLNGAETLGQLSGTWTINEDKTIRKNNTYSDWYRAITDDTVWNFTGDFTINLEQVIRIPNGKTLTINGNGYNAVIQATAEIVNDSGTVYYMFHVRNGGKLILNGVTIDGGSERNSPLENRFLYVPTQTADADWEFEATDTTIQNFAYSGNIIRLCTNADAKFVRGKINNCRVTGENTHGVIYLIADQDGESAPSQTPTYRKFEMDGTTISNCAAEKQAAAGGIIRTNGQTLVEMKIYNTRFENNYSGGFGVLLWNAKGNCIVDNCVFIGNTAHKRGGAISSEGQNVEIRNSHFENNSAGDFGGAICLFPYRLDGKDTGSSEALEMTVTIGNGCTFINNRAAKGGAVAILVTASTSDNPTHLTATVDLGNGYMRNNYTTAENQTESNEGEGGGAIYAGCTQKDTDEGASLSAASKITLIVNSGSFYNNYSTGKKGGAILVDDLRNNNTADGVNSVIVNGGTFGGNGTANTSKYGGAIAIEDGNLRMAGGEISYNTATADGGAIYVSGGSFTMTNGSITQNTATEHGGAAYVAGGNVTIHHGIINHNSATDGGAVYMDGDDSTTLYFQSGQMNNNYASDDGGAIYATGGTLHIGLEGCPGHTNDANNNTHQDLDSTGFCQYHPLIQENKAEDVGGGIALAGKDASSGDLSVDENGTLSGGTVHFYCGVANTNMALYKGVGLNVFMQGGEFHYYEGTDIGEPHDPDLVIIGGDLINHDTSKEYIWIYYYKNNTDNSDEPDFKGMAALDSYMNLPEGEYFWTAESNEVFVGWTPFGPDATEGQKSVRDKNDYKPSGTSVQINDTEGMREQQNTFDGSEDKTMHLYAIWAPKTSYITYVDSLTNAKSTTPSASGTTQYTLHKGSTQTITIPATNSAAHPGFAIVGWYLYQDEGQNANWCDNDFNAYEPAYTGNVLIPYSNLVYDKTFGNGGMVYLPLSEPNADLALTIDPMTFGNITLVAKYELQYSDLIISKSGAQDIDENQTFLFNITGSAAAKSDSTIKNTSALALIASLDDVSMQVVIEGNGSIRINHLPLGTYTVTEERNWSWRYTPDDVTQEVQLMDSSKTEQVDFRNTRSKIYWLSGDSYCTNWWGGNGGTKVEKRKVSN